MRAQQAADADLPALPALVRQGCRCRCGVEAHVLRFRWKGLHRSCTRGASLCNSDTRNSRFVQNMRFRGHKKRAAQGRPFEKGLRYFEYTRWPRRFCCQHCSLCSVQNGFSLP
jgi:hypothetical protein